MLRFSNPRLKQCLGYRTQDLEVIKMEMQIQCVASEEKFQMKSSVWTYFVNYNSIASPTARPTNMLDRSTSQFEEFLTCKLHISGNFVFTDGCKAPTLGYRSVVLADRNLNVRELKFTIRYLNIRRIFLYQAIQ